MDDRTLILLRHAKSDYPGGVADHDRPLAPRGRREAALAGAAITERFPVISQVLCSGATRTRETFATTGIDAPATFSEAIYEAAPDDILTAIAELADDPEVLLVVGHAPGMPATALRLADADSDADIVDTIQNRFPTSAFAVLTVHGGWSDLGDGTATVTELVIPRA